MTTEIAVANRWGIALAADSAVTIEQNYKGRPTEKVYNSANKLFTLSKFHPVGLMIFNGMTLGGTPWETVIKIIRRELNRKEFDSLEEYGTYLFNAISTHTMLFPKDLTNDVVERSIYRILYEVLEDYLDQKDADYNFAMDALSKKRDFVVKEDRIDGMDEEFEQEIISTHSGEIEKILAYIAPRYKEVEGFLGVAQELVIASLTRKLTIPGYSGVVVCGFGANDVFPKLYEYRTDCIICNRVRFWLHDSRVINAESASFVLPFADSEVIKTLMNGISPSFYGKFANETYKMITALPGLLVSQISELNEQDKEKYSKLLTASIEQPFLDLGDELNQYRMDEYMSPIENTIQVLPISELATVAETFISAAQIHKKVNPLLDTVGGPVDVAVISKGDGFVWVKRKHYFDKELNPAFVQKYLDA